MSKVIGTVDLPGTKIQGTPQEVAQQLFENIIIPNTEMLARNDSNAAASFGFHIMAMAVSQFAECVTTEDFKKHMEIVVNKVELILKKERGELSN